MTKTLQLRDLIEKKITIKLELTADDWQLYTASTNCTKAAMALNKAIETAVNTGLSRYEVERAANVAMRANDKYGATDTEPRWVLNDILDEVFGAALGKK